MRTSTLRPGTVGEWEARFAQRHPYREKHAPLGAFWHTEFGSLNQVMHVWLYETLHQRQEAREAAAREPDLQRLPGGRAFVVSQASEMFIPAPFMRPLGGDQVLGALDEMRMYTYQPGALAEVIKSGTDAMPHREQYSPLAAAMSSDMGGLNKGVHLWPYQDLNERHRIRAEATQDPHWPPSPFTRHLLMKQENKVLVPAAIMRGVKAHI